jgi:hypothetical protein
MAGRPKTCVYDPDKHPVLAAQAAREGLVNKEIFARLGIGHTTFYIWRREHPEFCEALKEGKEVVDAKVEKALLTRALGYEYDEVEETQDIKQTESGEKVAHKRRIVRKKAVVPDVQAQRLWLLNRRPEQWRDKQEIEHSGKDGGPLEIYTMSDEEIERRAREILARRDGNTD